MTTISEYFFFAFGLYLLIIAYPTDIVHAQSLSVVPLDALNRVYPDQWPPAASSLMPLLSHP